VRAGEVCVREGGVASRLGAVVAIQWRAGQAGMSDSGSVSRGG
jgi:hypothetical protein